MKLKVLIFLGAVNVVFMFSLAFMIYHGGVMPKKSHYEIYKGDDSSKKNKQRR